jgi:23S rRNA (cytidine1920-2'-O)/16S rRNA (cytidine1409-2'-O)-methyltransferase
MGMRLDLALVERGRARSRNHAASLIEAERVIVNGHPARKASQTVEEDAEILVLEAIDYVSRAGHKLAGALDEFAEISVEGKLCLDVGASTGGFTEVLIRRGATRVVALDVGHDQLAVEMRRNRKVINLEGFNARELTPETLREATADLGTTVDVSKDPIQLVVSDLSFISLTLVLPAMASVAPDADFVLLVKPQFEVGKTSLNAKGIVNDHRLRAQSIRQVIDCAKELKLNVHGIAKSSLPGTHGNIEYLLWISAKADPNRREWSEHIEMLAKEK